MCAVWHRCNHTKKKMSMPNANRYTHYTYLHYVCTIEYSTYIVECTVSASSCSSYFCEASATISSFSFLHLKMNRITNRAICVVRIDDFCNRNLRAQLCQNLLEMLCIGFHFMNLKNFSKYDRWLHACTHMDTHKYTNMYTVIHRMYSIQTHHSHTFKWIEWYIFVHVYYRHRHHRRRRRRHITKIQRRADWFNFILMVFVFPSFFFKWLFIFVSVSTSATVRHFFGIARNMASCYSLSFFRSFLSFVHFSSVNFKKKKTVDANGTCRNMWIYMISTKYNFEMINNFESNVYT